MKTQTLKGLTVCFVLAVTFLLFTQPASAAANAPQPGTFSIEFTGQQEQQEFVAQGWTDDQNSHDQLQYVRFERRSGEWVEADGLQSANGSCESNRLDPDQQCPAIEDRYAAVSNYYLDPNIEHRLRVRDTDGNVTWSEAYRAEPLESGGYRLVEVSQTPRQNSFKITPQDARVGEQVTFSASGWGDEQTRNEMFYTAVGITSSGEERALGLWNDNQQCRLENGGFQPGQPSDCPAGEDLYTTTATFEEADDMTWKLRVQDANGNTAESAPIKMTVEEGQGTDVIQPPVDDQEQQASGQNSKGGSKSSHGNSGSGGGDSNRGAEAAPLSQATPGLLRFDPVRSISGRARGIWRMKLGIKCEAFATQTLPCNGSVRVYAAKTTRQGAKRIKRRVLLGSAPYALSAKSAFEPFDIINVISSARARRRIKAVTFRDQTLRVITEVRNSSGQIIYSSGGGNGRKVLPPHWDRLKSSKERASR
jgi:hypothetical protein